MQYIRNKSRGAFFVAPTKLLSLRGFTNTSPAPIPTPSTKTHGLSFAWNLQGQGSRKAEITMINFTSASLSGNTSESHHLLLECTSFKLIKTCLINIQHRKKNEEIFKKVTTGNFKMASDHLLTTATVLITFQVSDTKTTYISSSSQIFIGLFHTIQTGTREGPLSSNKNMVLDRESETFMPEV